jgi:hypothetical protein
VEDVGSDVRFARHHSSWAVAHSLVA